MEGTWRTWEPVLRWEHSSVNYVRTICSQATWCSIFICEFAEKVDAFLMEFQHSVNARSFNIKKEMLSYCFDISIQNLYSAEASLASILLGYDAKRFALDLRRYYHSSLQNLLRSTSVGCERDCLWTLDSHLRFPQLSALLLESDFSYPWPVAPSQLLKNPVLPPPSMLLCRRWAVPAFLQKKDTSNEGQMMIDLLECSPICSQGSAIGFLVTFLIKILFSSLLSLVGWPVVERVLVVWKKPPKKTNIFIRMEATVLFSCLWALEADS